MLGVFCFMSGMGCHAKRSYSGAWGTMISTMTIVPMLSVGMQLWTLCVRFVAFCITQGIPHAGA